MLINEDMKSKQLADPDSNELTKYSMPSNPEIPDGVAMLDQKYA